MGIEYRGEFSYAFGQMLTNIKTFLTPDTLGWLLINSKPKKIQNAESLPENVSELFN